MFDITRVLHYEFGSLVLTSLVKSLWPQCSYMELEYWSNWPWSCLEIGSILSFHWFATEQLLNLTQLVVLLYYHRLEKKLISTLSWTFYFILIFAKVADLRFATLLKRRVWHRCFPVTFAKFLRTPVFIKHLWWLLLFFCCCYIHDATCLKKGLIVT